MSNAPTVHVDERTIAVENASYRWAYLFMSFGLLLLVTYRSFVLQESPWDLLLLVILGGVVGTAYQGWHRILSKPWVIATVSAVIVAAALAILLIWFRG